MDNNQSTIDNESGAVKECHRIGCGQDFPLFRMHG